MVTVSTRPEPGSKVILEIEVQPAEVDRHFATAYRHVAERTKLPGFRPGKAPRHVIDRFVGRASVVAEAIDHLVSDSYDRALDEATIVPIDQPIARRFPIESAYSIAATDGTIRYENTSSTPAIDTDEVTTKPNEA